MATSKLQEYIYKRLYENFPHYSIKFNYRPSWLHSSDNKKLEMDLYIQELSIGIEVNGEQHYKFIPFFHKTVQDFEDRKRWDNEKKEICFMNGVQFYEITNKQEADEVVTIICSQIVKQKEIPVFTLSKLQRHTINGIEKAKQNKSKKLTIQALTDVARCVNQFNSGKEKILDARIGNYYIEKRREVDKILEAWRKAALQKTS